MVAVRISEGNELKVKSFYPVTETKIENRKKKEKQALEQALLEDINIKKPFN